MRSNFYRRATAVVRCAFRCTRSCACTCDVYAGRCRPYWGVSNVETHVVQIFGWQTQYCNDNSLCLFTWFAPSGNVVSDERRESRCTSQNGEHNNDDNNNDKLLVCNEAMHYKINETLTGYI